MDHINELQKRLKEIAQEREVKFDLARLAKLTDEKKLVEIVIDPATKKIKEYLKELLLKKFKKNNLNDKKKNEFLNHLEQLLIKQLELKNYSNLGSSIENKNLVNYKYEPKYEKTLGALEGKSLLDKLEILDEKKKKIIFFIKEINKKQISNKKKKNFINYSKNITGNNNNNKKKSKDIVIKNIQ